MRRARSVAVVMLALGCASASEPPLAPPSDTPPQETPSIDDEVGAWLDRASSAPRNGMNPQLELPPRIVTEGAAALERVIRSGPSQRRRDAAFALARHPEPRAFLPFWREQLASDEPEIRFRAVTILADHHDTADLEPVLRAYLAHDDLHHVLSVRLRDWNDRRAVIALVELLEGSAPIAENAADSLAMSPGVPALEAEPTTDMGPTHAAEGVWMEAPSSRVAPYRAWWDETGRAAFASECAWWATFAGGARSVCGG